MCVLGDPLSFHNNPQRARAAIFIIKYSSISPQCCQGVLISRLHSKAQKSCFIFLNWGYSSGVAGCPRLSMVTMICLFLRFDP